MDMITQFVILLVLALLVIFNFVDKSNKTTEIKNQIEYYVDDSDDALVSDEDQQIQE